MNGAGDNEYINLNNSIDICDITSLDRYGRVFKLTLLGRCKQIEVVALPGREFNEAEELVYRIERAKRELIRDWLYFEYGENWRDRRIG
jgi:hypothetical protein